MVPPSCHTTHVALSRSQEPDGNQIEEEEGFLLVSFILFTAEALFGNVLHFGDCKAEAIDSIAWPEVIF